MSIFVSRHRCIFAPGNIKHKSDDINKTKLKDIALLKGAGREMLPASCGVACQSRKHFSNDENRTGRIVQPTITARKVWQTSETALYRLRKTTMPANSNRNQPAKPG